MDAEYHIEVTRQAIGNQFGATALEEIIRANLTQDYGWNQFKLELHFDNNMFDESLDHIAVQHTLIAALTNHPGGDSGQRRALGRLFHTVQDFYSHSNYVDLWLAANGGLEATQVDDINGLDTALLNHPDLVSGYFYPWRDFVYHIPVLKNLMRRIYIPPNSHEEMNLDTPAKGPRFDYSLVAARQRTRHEYEQAVRAILAAGGEAALARFHQCD